MADEQRPAIRVGDVEREQAAALLRRHATDGRLTLDELDQRLRDAYAARTVPELNRLLEDLPSIRTDVELVKPGDRPASRGQRVSGDVDVGGGSRMVWASWAAVNLLMVVIWLVAGIAGASWYPWFLWVAGPWGAVLAGREIQNRARRREIEG